jgi:hypothetical protein
VTHWTENMIRERLDGTYTRLLHNGQIEVVEVGVGYLPGQPLGTPKAKPQAAWSPEEDDTLCRLRRLGRPFNEIAWLLSRSEDSAKKRLRALRVKGLAA